MAKSATQPDPSTPMTEFIPMEIGAREIVPIFD